MSHIDLPAMYSKLPFDVVATDLGIPDRRRENLEAIRVTPS